MFTKTNKPQLALFTETRTLLPEASLKTYSDQKGWHNQFREQITCRIKEELFRPLFCQDDGAPNASIRVLIGMMILKEARGLSDSQLFEECRFNLLVRIALGIPNIDDSIPVESTYYLLRKRIVEWEEAGNENLIEKVFAQVTKEQVVELEINGKKVRMDSKLLGSNISWYSRYELLHETVGKAYGYLKKEGKELQLSGRERELLESTVKETGGTVSYRSSKAEIEVKVGELGVVIYKIIQQEGTEASGEVQTLRRVFEEQYIVKGEVVTVRPKKEIRAESIQSPYDTDCHYRNKGGNQIKGYSINVTETCDKADPVNLITNVQVDTASTADVDFLQPALEATREVIGRVPETVNTDGAYHSKENQEYCDTEGIDLILGAMQGKPPRYDLSYGEGNELIIIDLKTNEILPSREIQSRKDGTTKWVIKDEEGNSRYFTEKEVETNELRREIAARPMEEKNVRNNVESTIFQLGYHYPDDKSRYRGLIQHKIWANARCLWINFARILKYMIQKEEMTLANA